MSHLTSIKDIFWYYIISKIIIQTLFFLSIFSLVVNQKVITAQILLSSGPHQVQPLRFKSSRTFAPGEIATQVSKCCRNILVVSLWSFKVQRQVNNVNRPAMIATTYSRGHKTQYAGHLFAIRWCFTQKCIHNLRSIAFNCTNKRACGDYFIALNASQISWDSYTFLRNVLKNPANNDHYGFFGLSTVTCHFDYIDVMVVPNRFSRNYLRRDKMCNNLPNKCRRDC